MAFYETSAKDKTMVDDAFFALTRDIKKRLGESSSSSSANKPASGPITVPAPGHAPRLVPHPGPHFFCSFLECGLSVRYLYGRYHDGS